MQAVRGLPGALRAWSGFGRRPAAGGLFDALHAVDHDLLEEVDGGGPDGPDQAQVSQVGAGVARQSLARVKQLAAVIAKDRWRRLHIWGEFKPV